MTGIMSFINNFWSDFVGIFQNVFLWIGDILGSFLALCMDGVFSLVLAFVNALTLPSAAFNAAAQWSALPPQLIYLVNAFGVPQGLTLLASAYLIRLTLNFLPASITRV